MKNIICFVLIVIVLGGWMNIGSAAEKIPLSQTPQVERLKEGMGEFFTSPVVLGEHVADYTEAHELKILGFFAGFFEGTGQMVNQGIAGFVKVLTFPFAR